MISVHAKFADKAVVEAFKNAAAQLKGRRKFPPAVALKDKKTKEIHEPWKKKGIDETGRGDRWEPNAPGYTRSKLGRIRIFKSRKEITLADRKRLLMTRTGKLKRKIRAGWTPKKSEFAITVPGVSYAYYQLYRNPRTGAPARPWGVWTIKDQKFLLDRINQWAAKF